MFLEATACAFLGYAIWDLIKAVYRRCKRKG